MPNILIVEDDPTLNETLTQRLKTQGFEVYSAANGKQGLSVLSTATIHLILVDILMPEMDGIEMIYHWNQKHTAAIPIILLTNLAETSVPDTISKMFIKADTPLQVIVDEVNKQLGLIPN